MRLALFAIVMLASTARADDDERIQFLSIGGITSMAGGHHTSLGLGGEITYTSLSSGIYGNAYGAYLDVETGKLKDGSIGDTTRIAAGGFVVEKWAGLEAGGLYRTAPDIDNTAGVQLGFFITCGLFSLEARASLSRGGSSYGSDIGLVFAGKFPIQTAGHAIDFGKGTHLLPCIWRCKY